MSVPFIDVENISEQSSRDDPEDIPLNPATSSVHLSPPKNKYEISYTPSFESFAIFKDATFFDVSANRQLKKSSCLKGPRKFLRLCAFGFCLPVLFLSIPLYVRLILYPPTHVPMAPTDQRLLSGRVSSVWCKGQSFHMNGSFNAFMMNEKPHMRKEFSVHTMKKHVLLKDDFKEYWGFFLQKGSVVNIDLCIRHDGGSLMILEGVSNLRKCAWIGEKDSAEQDDDHNEESNESGQIPDSARYVPDGLRVDTPKWAVPVATSNNVSTQSETHSYERKKELDFFMRKVVQLSKNSNEILNSLQKNRKPKGLQEVDYKKETKKLRQREHRKTKNLKENKEIERLERSLNEKVSDSDGSEILDAMENLSGDNYTLKYYNATEAELYKRIFHTPQGLNIERGVFFHRDNTYDTSNEEHRSSFSSSEEALLNCAGLLGAIPLYADRNCHSIDSPFSNNITYKIPATGTYYFVFSSDNEVFDSDMYFNMTLKRVIYDTDLSVASCVNKSSCSLDFTFWSHSEAIVEVPEGNWDSAFIISSKCEPRVSLYLLIVILIPLFILIGAFH